MFGESKTIVMLEKIWNVYRVVKEAYEGPKCKISFVLVRSFFPIPTRSPSGLVCYRLFSSVLANPRGRPCILLHLFCSGLPFHLFRKRRKTPPQVSEVTHGVHISEGNCTILCSTVWEGMEKLVVMAVGSPHSCLHSARRPPVLVELSR